MTDTDLPAALAEPVTRVRPGWTSLLFLANIGLWLGIYAPIQVLLPEQAELLDAADKELVFGIVTGVGAVVSLFANPLVGLASDRTRSRFGRRHPWTLLGALVGAAGLVVLALAANVFVMTVGWCVVQAGLNGMLATLTSAVPDRVPVEQRAQIGGLVGISQMLGTVLGAVLVTVLVTSLPGGYVACAGLVVLGAAVFVLRTPDLALPRGWRPAHGWREVLAELWVSPRAHPDFAWAWSCHFLINLGNALGTFFLLFFLKDAVHYPDPDTGLLIMMGLYGAALVVGGLTVGWLSDRSGRLQAVRVAFGAGDGRRGVHADYLADLAGRTRRVPTAGRGLRRVLGGGAGDPHPGAPGRAGPRQGPGGHQHREPAAAGHRPPAGHGDPVEPGRLPGALRSSRSGNAGRGRRGGEGQEREVTGFATEQVEPRAGAGRGRGVQRHRPAEF